MTTERPAASQAKSTSADTWPTYSGSKGLDKPRVVVLGSGWAAISFLKALKQHAADKYEIVLVSPRNYFLYTPLLPAVATGTIEERSIVEPVRRLIGKKGKYFEAVVQDIDPADKSLVACFPLDANLGEACFKLPYDILVIGVGSVNNTFGIEGVTEHCFFFKGIRDAQKLRRQISECFERASLPQTPTEERQRLLSFVIVGGGPTGVEVAAELHDTIQQDLVKLYPELVPDVRIRIIELMDHVLSTYDRAISTYTGEQFKRAGIELVLNSKVVAVQKNSVRVVDKQGNKTDIPFGAAVWSTGVAMHPLIKQLQAKLPEGTQTHFRSIVTDEYLCVKGSNGTIYALGDAATIEQERALDHVGELWERADVDKDDKLQLLEIRNILRDASARFPQFEEHARFLDGKVGAKRFGGIVANALAGARAKNEPQKHTKPNDPIWGDLDFDEKTEVTREQFEDMLKKIDSGLRALPATAQVAKQQGEYLAKLMDKTKLEAGKPVHTSQKPFKYGHKGAFAYVGGDKAVMDSPLGKVTGLGAGVLWRGFETYSQFSFRNVVLVSLDWARTKIFGRDISRV
ncbi:hypothetical protein WJX72_011009 [[Myrmecia] bisecta]|uniref:NADH:ubiquinone reductase (non-electrogenic) n=1 Tax=[Myrmecia] bisecta TaxID=41462 RepID=A0AAW1R9V7_9CHLO